MKNKYIKPIIECTNMDISEAFLSTSTDVQNGKATNSELLMFEDDYEEENVEDETWNNIIGL